MYFVDSLSQDRLTALIKWYKEHGISPRVKRSGGRRSNTKALLFDDIKQVVHFIASYAEDHALALPGRIPGVEGVECSHFVPRLLLRKVWPGRD